MEADGALKLRPPRPKLFLLARRRCRRRHVRFAAAALGDHVVRRQDAGLEQIAGDACADQRRHDEQPDLRERMRVRRQRRR